MGTHTKIVVVKAKEIFVFVHKDAVSDELKAKANGFIFIGLESNNILYNGKQPLALKKGNKRIANLPGPPKEFTYVLNHALVPYLEKEKQNGFTKF